MNSRDIIPQGTFYAAVIYRTKDGQADYKFDIVQMSDGYRVYINSQPSYNGRATDGHTTHRYTEDGSGRKYICFTGPLKTFSEAKAVASAWADGTQRYIKTGKDINA